jgi:isoleucyl-tRNA synthetase
LDTEIHPELAQEGLAREIINRVQKLRKKAGLQPTDDIRMEYRVYSDPDNVGLETAFESQSTTFEKSLRRPLDKIDDNSSQDGLIMEEDQEVQQATFLLRLLKL